MTQTTAERICRLIIERLRILNGTMGAVMANNAAQQIAAEIDALTRERDEARAALATMNADRCEILREFGALQGREAKTARELAEARAYISTIIDAPGVNG